jgi:DNA recombination protein RmuC
MEYIAVALLVVVLIVLIILLVRKPETTSAQFSVEDFERVRVENESLKINLAKADERVSNLSTE